MPQSRLDDPLLAPGHHLNTPDGHVLWWAAGGPADAGAVLVVHGGPGGRSRPQPLQWLQGARWLCPDQRGCGRSQPRGELRHNTLAHLLDDLDRVLDAAGIPAVALLAGSWGAVLALEYARTRPGRVRGLMLRSAFLGSVAEVDAFFAPWATWTRGSGLSAVGPLAHVDAAGRVDETAAHAWRDFEDYQARPGGLGAAGGENLRFDAAASPPADAATLDSLAVQAHYLRAHCFLPPDARLRWQRSLSALRVPVTLVHGTADAVCPADNSRWLATLWPQAELNLVPGAGHRMDDPRLANALRAAAARWLQELGPR